MGARESGDLFYSDPSFFFFFCFAFRFFSPFFSQNFSQKKITQGGGIASMDHEASLSLQSCIIEKNTASKYGGGLFVSSPLFSLSNSDVLVRYNSAGMAGAGAALRASSASASMGSLSFYGNNVTAAPPPAPQLPYWPQLDCDYASSGDLCDFCPITDGSPCSSCLGGCTSESDGSRRCYFPRSANAPCPTSDGGGGDGGNNVLYVEIFVPLIVVVLLVGFICWRRRASTTSVPYNPFPDFDPEYTPLRTQPNVMVNRGNL